MDNEKKKLKPNTHTFVVCAYGDSPYLEACLASLKKQTVQSEVIMITSTPSDYISDLAIKYNIKLFINNGESGIAQDWNFGLSKCQSRFVTIAHQDDIYSEMYLEKILDCLKKKRKALIAFSDYGEIRNNKNITKSKLLCIKRIMLLPLRISMLQDNKLVKKLILKFGNPICCPSVTYCMDRLSKPIFEVKYGSNLDWQTWVGLSKLPGAFAYTNKILMFHRIHEKSTTSELIGSSDRSKEDLNMFMQMWPKSIARIIEKMYKKSENLNK